MKGAEILDEAWNDLVARHPALAVDKSDPRRQMLLALQSKPLYAGTVDEGTKQQRRAKNRAARKSRRTNRGRR